MTKHADHLKTILLSGLVGFALLALIFPGLADNVESAQVLAGVVKLPADNPMGMYHLSATSLLIDLAALLLLVGFSAWAVCVFFTGLMGAAVFAGLTSATLVFSRNALVSLLVPVLMLFMCVHPQGSAVGYPYLQTLHGHAYPIMLANHSYVFGVYGLFLTLLAWSLLALGMHRAGALLVGLLLWIHPAMGMACVFGGALGLYGTKGGMRPGELGAILRWFCVGAAFSLAGIGFHWLFVRPDLSAYDSGLAAQLLANFEDNWDSHRILSPQAIPWMLEVEAYVLVLFAAIFLKGGEIAHRGARFLAFSLLAVSAVGVSYLAAAYFAPGLAPEFLRRIMVTRWLNLNSMVFPAMVFGVLGNLALGRKNPAALAVLGGLSALMLLFVVKSTTVAGGVWGYFGEGGAPASALSSAIFPVLGGGGVVLLLLFQKHGRVGGWPLYPKIAAGLVAVLLAMPVLLGFVPRFDAQRLTGNDPLNGFMEELSRGEGLILVPEATALRIPLRTGRGVLVDPEQIDIITYVPQAGPRMEEIFNNVYGRTMMRARGDGEPLDLPRWLVPRAWLGFSKERWREIARDYKVTTVLMPWEFSLDLPLEAQCEPYFRAYRLPVY